MTTSNSDMRNLDNTMARTAVQATAAVQSGIKGNTNESDELLEVNQVSYVVPPSLSIVSKRTRIVNNFMQTSYNQPQNTTMSLIFNTGEFYIQPCTSYIAIQLAIRSGLGTTDASPITDFQVPIGSGDPTRGDPQIFYDIPDGNACSIIEEVVMTTASGTEINREQKKGLNSNACFPYIYTEDYKESYGTGQGFSWKASMLDGTYRRWPSAQRGLPPGGKNVRNFNTTTAIVNGAATAWEIGPTLYIPLTQLAGVFNPYNKALIPASLLSGGRLDIRLSDPTLVFRAGGTNANVTNFGNGNLLADMRANYYVENIYLNLDCFQMADGVLKRLNEIAAGQNGLNYLFDTYDWSQTNTTQASVECQVSQARSRIINSICVVRNPANFTNPGADKLASEPAIRRPSSYLSGLPLANNVVTSYQAVLGSLFFPQQPLTQFRDFLENAYYIWNKSACDMHNNSSICDEDFAGADGNIWQNDGVTPRAVYPDNGYLNNALWSTFWNPNYGKAIYGMVAERSSYLQLSGIPISNARLLRHRFTFAQAYAREIAIFTSFSRMIRIYLGGRVLVRE